MRLENEAAATAFRVLDKCSTELEATGPWRWRCVVQDGALLPLTSSVEEGFLQLAGQPEEHGGTARLLERALLENNTLAGGVKFALNAASRGLHLRTEILVLQEKQLLERVQWALAGFHDGCRRLKSLDSSDQGIVAPTAGPSGIRLGELLRETLWSCTERGPNEFSVDLRRAPAPPARITTNEYGVVSSVELVRCDTEAEISRQALSVFLLTASSALRLVRAHAVEEAEGQRSFGLQVSLPAAPAVEEIDHALAALSTAYWMCAREANVLRDEAAAQCYLSVRNLPFTYKPEKEKEI
jgi:hypothetical protein